MNRLSYLSMCALAAFLISAAPGGKKHVAVSPQARSGSPKYTRLNINNLSHWFGADLSSANDPRTGNSGLEFPRGISATLATIFFDGLVWGGNVRDGRTPGWRAGGVDFNSGVKEGAIISQGVPEDPTDPSVRIYRIRRDYATADLALDAAELGLDEETVRAQYKTDWLEWPAAKGAPFYDADGDGKYTPGFRRTDEGIETPKLAPLPWETFDPTIHADEPGLANADQVIWTVANDLSEGQVAGFAGSLPIGLEVQLTVWGYNHSEGLSHAIFKRYKLVYKGAANTPEDASIDSMYLAQWSDPDIGSYSDDFVGVDSTSSLMFAYNSSDIDAAYSSYGLPPPSMGYDFLQGPLVPGEQTDQGTFDFKKRRAHRNLSLSSFAYVALGMASCTFSPEGTYQRTLEWLNVLHGFLICGDFFHPSPYVNTVTRRPTKFPLSGDPVTGIGDVDGVTLAPGDRQMIGVSGPFSLALGDTQEVVIATIATIAALGSDRLNSVALLKEYDRAIQQLYDGQFWTFQPTAPNVRVTGLDGQIVLNWGFDADRIALTERVSSGHSFEGYNVYQLRAPLPDLSADNAKRIATFDRADGIRAIVEKTFDEKLGYIVEKVVQFGGDSGIRHTLVVKTDAFRERPIANYQDYHFAVTSYYVLPPDGSPQGSVESQPRVITVRAMQPEPGARLNAGVGQTLNVTHVGSSDGSVIATVIVPTEVTGDDYEVMFGERSETGGGRRLRWHLLNTTTGDTVLANQSKQAADSSDVAFPNADGILVQVLAGSAQTPNTPDDAFFFSTKSLEKTTNDLTKKSDALARVNVFLNPFLGVGRMGGPGNGSLVRFTNLPPATTIRIFTLAGTLTRKLPPESQDGQTHDWNLRDRFGKRVASGIYLVHVEMPGVGSKILKLVIVR